MIVAIILSILSGVTIVLSRTTNALLSEKSSTLVSTFYNYAIGMAFSALFLLILGRSELSIFSHSSYLPFYYYLGGFLGVAAVFFSAYLAIKISSLVMTILMFFGQISGAIILDWLLSGSIDYSNILGGILVLLGLFFINHKE